MDKEELAFPILSTSPTCQDHSSTRSKAPCTPPIEDPCVLTPQGPRHQMHSGSLLHKLHTQQAANSLLLFCVSLFRCKCTHMFWMHNTCTCMWKPEVNSECHSFVHCFVVFYFFFFLSTGSHMGLEPTK